MKITILANCDCELVPELCRYPMAEVYGKLTGDLVGGGRPCYMGTPLDMSALGRYVAVLQRQRREFNYRMNSSCQRNHEWTRSWRKRFMQLIDRLGNTHKDKLNADLLAFLKS